CCSALEEAANGFAVDPEADHLRAVVDLLDRLHRDELAAAREEAGANRQRVGALGRGAVHRALDGSDQATLRICDEEARGAAEIDCECAHLVVEPIPRLRGNTSFAVKLL